MAFPAGTPTQAQVRGLWDQCRNQIEFRYIREALAMYVADLQSRGVDVVPWVDSEAIPSRIPEGYTEANARILKQKATEATSAVLDSFEAAYAPFFSKTQETELEELYAKYAGYRNTLNKLHTSSDIQAVKDLTRDWKEKAADPFRDEFLMPLRGAITRHRDIAGYMAGALAMEASAQVAIRKAFAELPLAACSPHTSYGQGAQNKQTLSYISIGLSVVGLATIPFPVVGAIVGVGGLVASVLAESIQNVQISLKIPDTTNMKFGEFVNTVHAAITSLSNGLDEGREQAAKNLRESMAGATYDIEEWKTKPNHYAPGSELLD
ncbi:hypothetical protein O1R50_19330 [Glycomyces luteolus]|uniref:Uncharacterized protein n=1 Tax=Glycomyces luteolus TaxID=2670330 RepID=A0A9X3PFS3_9ACTN|nr:hypothetical protein [Glycomyces luteolus]MDA1361789.1 hypothetical protein [Glycomyces luteolus]